MKPATAYQDVYSLVESKIIPDLEKGTLPWLKPWSAAHTGAIALPVRHNGIPYRGINILLLWGAALDKGYTAPRWMTFKQAQDLGGHVRKDEHGSLVVFSKPVTKTEANDNGEEIEREIRFMKGYKVFNVEQIDGLPDSYAPPALATPQPGQVIEAAERFFAGTGAIIRNGGNRAYYAHGGDYIQLPPPQSFKDAESYAATKAHELTHWSGHHARLARSFGKRFGDDAYAFEELVAELGSAFLSVHLGITPALRDDHAAYLASWLKVLKADKKAIFTAASHAQKAVDYLQSLQQGKAMAA